MLNATTDISIDESLISYEEEKNEKEMLYMLLAQIQNLQISYVCNEHGMTLMLCVGQCREKYHTEKASWMSAYVSHISVHD